MIAFRKGSADLHLELSSQSQRYDALQCIPLETKQMAFGDSAVSLFLPVTMFPQGKAELPKSQAEEVGLETHEGRNYSAAGQTIISLRAHTESEAHTARFRSGSDGLI